MAPAPVAGAVRRPVRALIGGIAKAVGLGEAAREADQLAAIRRQPDITAQSSRRAVGARLHHVDRPHPAVDPARDPPRLIFLTAGYGLTPLRQVVRAPTAPSFIASRTLRPCSSLKHSRY